MPKLSLTLITLNEADRLGATLDAVRCADEILVVDGGSSDDTVRIGRERGCRVIERRFEGFGPQKRFAAEQASNDWILNIDADEVLTPELNEEIRQLLANGDPPKAAYRVPMTLVFMGRVFRHGRHANERHVRLFDRRRAAYDSKEVHEGLVVDGPIGDLQARLHHHSFRDLSHFIDKMNAYTTLGARDLQRRGKRRSAGLIALSAPYYFGESYFLRGNFLNGAAGLCWSMLYATMPIVKYLKLLESRGES